MPGSSEFNMRTKYLEDQVGSGRIKAGVTVDQPYAQNQHENLSFNHTVGRAHYLGAPLMENAFNFVDGMARAAVTDEGSRIKDEMQDIAEDLSRAVLTNAPRDPDIGDNLANSGSPWVVDGGMEIFRRPPLAPRQMKSKSGWVERPPEKYV
jgi:hypothetical protein